MQHIQILEYICRHIASKGSLIFIDILPGSDQVSVREHHTIFQNAIAVTDVFQFPQIMRRNDYRQLLILHQICKNLLEMQPGNRLQTIVSLI